MLNIIRKTDFGSRNEIWFYNFAKQNSYLFFSFSSWKLHKNYKMSDKINLFNVKCLQKFSLNGKIWLTKKLYITRFNWA